MPDIKRSYVFSSEFKKRLDHKFKVLKLDHKSWSDPDIEDIRVSVRDFYRSEQGGKCCYCQTPISLISARNADIEHIAPKSKYMQFITAPLNLCVSCVDCNETKRSSEVFVRTDVKRYPSKGKSFLIFHPHFDNFVDHFEVQHNIFFGLSKRAEYTIYLCDMNRIYKRFRIPPADPEDQELHKLFFDYMSERNFTRKLDLRSKLKEKFS